jgi:hypothetical protein
MGQPGYELVSLKNNDPVPPGRMRDSLRTLLGGYSDAFYETARYLIYNNKKK